MNKMEIGIYIHIPFCIRKCHYCSFNSVNNQQELIEPYVSSLLKEIEVRSRDIKQYKAKSVYIGGGTPTILKPAHLNMILDNCRRHFNLQDNIEITIEANPKTVDNNKLIELGRAGFNRMSIGIQSFNDNELKLLGRQHNSDDAISAFKAARCANFNNIGIDLIYGIPYQKMEDWEDTLGKAIKLDPEHISIYSLSIEKGTLFDKYVAEDKIFLLSDDKAADMYNTAYTRLKEAGHIPYEISNFSKPGYFSIHNHIYWNNGEYIGIGVGAYSYINKNRSWNISDISKYIEMNGDAIEGQEHLKAGQILAETIMVRLRTIDGIDIGGLNSKFKIDFLKQYKEKISKLMDAGLIEIADNHLKLTRKGILLLNEVAVEFV